MNSHHMMTMCNQEQENIANTQGPPWGRLIITAPVSNSIEFQPHRLVLPVELYINGNLQSIYILCSLFFLKNLVVRFIHIPVCYYNPHSCVAFLDSLCEHTQVS